MSVIRKVKVLNMYSELSPQLDVIVVVHRENQEQLAEEIIAKAFDDWFELEDDLDVQSMPFGDYIESKLKEAHIGYEFYIKVGDNL